MSAPNELDGVFFLSLVVVVVVVVVVDVAIHYVSHYVCSHFAHFIAIMARLPKGSLASLAHLR